MSQSPITSSGQTEGAPATPGAPSNGPLGAQQPPVRVYRTVSDGPRRVQGGAKLIGKQSAQISTWAGRRWMRCVEEGARGDALTEGLEFARLGQTRELKLEPGAFVALVQDRNPRAQRVRIAARPFTPEQWESVFAVMSDQAIYAAKLLAGEMPVNIEDLFAPLGLRLFPSEPGDLAPTCDCDAARDEPGVWCRHACCAGILAAERVDLDPFLVIALRGLPAGELASRLNRRRGIVVGEAAIPAYQPRPAPGAETVAPGLETLLDEFWSIGPELDEIETAARKPEVNHALLRRLGPSPLEGRFPLAGLLATCYDAIGQAALRGADEAAEQEAGEDPEADLPTPGAGEPEPG